ncbi:MAG: hypothetical protein OXC81_06365 [Betaproteobacteria bacterium]|nr:hypothetical protein [Betaproteobacteria bacterium]
MKDAPFIYKIRSSQKKQPIPFPDAQSSPSGKLREKANQVLRHAGLNCRRKLVPLTRITSLWQSGLPQQGRTALGAGTQPEPKL